VWKPVDQESVTWQEMGCYRGGRRYQYSDRERDWKETHLATFGRILRLLPSLPRLPLDPLQLRPLPSPLPLCRLRALTDVNNLDGPELAPLLRLLIRVRRLSGDVDDVKLRNGFVTELSGEVRGGEEFGEVDGGGRDGEEEDALKGFRSRSDRGSALAAVAAVAAVVVGLVAAATRGLGAGTEDSFALNRLHSLEMCEFVELAGGMTATESEDGGGMTSFDGDGPAWHCRKHRSVEFDMETKGKTHWSSERHPQDR
jgi:hypothetical protein